MLAAGTAAQASIQEITDAADVGFGSFYNHFSSKTQLFEAAVADVLEELGELFDRLTVDVQDAALAFAQSERLTLRLCRDRRQISAVLIRHGMHYVESERGVAPRLLRDIRAGMASGRFLAAALAGLGSLRWRDNREQREGARLELDPFETEADMMLVALRRYLELSDAAAVRAGDGCGTAGGRVPAGTRRSRYTCWPPRRAGRRCARTRPTRASAGPRRYTPRRRASACCW